MQGYGFKNHEYGTIVLPESCIMNLFSLFSIP